MLESCIRSMNNFPNRHDEMVSSCPPPNFPPDVRLQRGASIRDSGFSFAKQWDVECRLSQAWLRKMAPMTYSIVFYSAEHFLRLPRSF